VFKPSNDAESLRFLLYNIWEVLDITLLVGYVIIGAGLNRSGTLHGPEPQLQV